MKHKSALTDHFKQISFFSACTDKELELVSRATTEIRFPDLDRDVADRRRLCVSRFDVTSAAAIDPEH